MISLRIFVDSFRWQVAITINGNFVDLFPLTHDERRDQFGICREIESLYH